MTRAACVCHALLAIVPRNQRQNSQHRFKANGLANLATQRKSNATEPRERSVITPLQIVDLLPFDRTGHAVDASRAKSLRNAPLIILRSAPRNFSCYVLLLQLHEHRQNQGSIALCLATIRACRQAVPHRKSFARLYAGLAPTRTQRQNQTRGLLLWNFLNRRLVRIFRIW